MIAYIKGILEQINVNSIVVDVQGIGYEIICANPFAFQHLEKQEIFIHTFHHVREDAQILYGFKLPEEKQLFTKLISVSGIGPKSGLAIQGSVKVDDFIQAVEREDEKYLTQFPGVGKKTARQIILDLKGKLLDIATTKLSTEVLMEPADESGKKVTEVIEVLKSLGYTERETNKIRPQLKGMTNLSIDEMIKKAFALFIKN